MLQDRDSKGRYVKAKRSSLASVPLPVHTETAHPCSRIFPHCTDEEFMAEENPQIPFSGIMAGGTGPTIATGNPFSPRMALFEQGGRANADITATSTGMEARWVDLCSTEPRGEPPT